MFSRVHWLLWHLPPFFKAVYRLYYCYDTHNYKFIRYRHRTPLDEFTIIRTSKHCFRVVYFSFISREIVYKSFNTSSETARFLVEKSGIEKLK